jgi:hypothetical protein
MPRFYFHIRASEKIEADTEGTEFDSLECAVDDARLAAREILAEKVLTGETIDDQAFEISSSDGAVLAIVPFHSVLKLH